MKRNLSEILTIDGLKIGYGTGRHKKYLLPPLNACALKGELIAVIGRNGIGKSTLLKTLAGLQPFHDGEILYDGMNLKDYSRIYLAQKVSYISTEIVKVSNMSVYDLVALGRFPHTNWIGKIDENNNRVILDSIARTGMSILANRPVSELSDGERQRAMIARILAQDTGIMIMDEPTAFLDIGSKFEILHLMQMLSGENGKTIIFSTHDLHLAISQADKIWLILNDSLIEGAPEDLMIKGAFDHLFDQSPVKFNSENGIFTFVSENRGSVWIDGDGIFRHWTEQAVIRAGYSLSETVTRPYIKVPSVSEANWKVSTTDSYFEFGSLYDLVGWLSKQENLIS